MVSTSSRSLVSGEHTYLDFQCMAGPVSLLLLNGVLLLDALGCSRHVLAPGCLCSFQCLHLHLAKQLIIIAGFAKPHSGFRRW